MSKALLAGTFDPPTLGHFDLIMRASKCFNALLIGVAKHPEKTANNLFSLDERINMLLAITAHLPNVEIVAISGLVVDTAKEMSVDVLVRGFRTISDVSYEQELAATNLKVGNLETLFLMGEQALSQVSSTLVRNLARQGKPLDKFVPGALVETIAKKMKK